MISLYGRFSNTVSFAANHTIAGVTTVVSKTRDIWRKTPKALKLSLETAALFHIPGKWVGWKGIAGATTLALEIPQTLAAFLINKPVQLFGRQCQLFPSPFPQNLTAPLASLELKIHAFERGQPIPPSPFLTSKIQPVPPQHQELIEITDKKLDVLIERASSFSILKAMHMASGVAETDAPLFHLVGEMSRTKQLSPWDLFVSTYGAKLTLWGRLKAGMLYFFFRPFLSKAINVYLKNMLRELRVNLKENDQKRTQFLQALLQDANHFFDAYNGAIERYIQDSSGKESLDQYQTKAVHEVLHQKDLCRKLSISIVDYFSPKIGLRFWEKWGHSYLQKKILQNNLLPQILYLMKTETGEEASHHNLLCLLSLTKTLLSQITKIQKKLNEEDPTLDPPVWGIQPFESVTKKCLWSLDLAGCTTREEIRLRMEQGARPKIQTEIHHGIQVGFQKGLALLFDFLSKEENIEELFSDALQTVSDTLSQDLPSNEDEWGELEREYEKTKILLHQAGSLLSKQLVQKALEEQLEVGEDARTARMAQKVFADHQMRGQETFKMLHQMTLSIQEKLKPSERFAVHATDLLPELSEMASLLKVFGAEERRKTAVKSDLLPPFSSLPPVEQETILRVLHPLYKGSVQIMDIVLELQRLQTQLSLVASLRKNFQNNRSSREEKEIDEKEKTIWNQMNQQATQLKSQVAKFAHLIERAKKETLLPLSASQLSQVGGVVGFLLGLAGGTLAPEIGGVLGAIAASATLGIEDLIQGRGGKFLVSLLGASTVVGATTRLLTKAAAISHVTLLPSLISAAAASAGMEYAGKNIRRRLVHTGVKIAAPTVANVFDKAYEHFLTRDLVINSALTLFMKQIGELFPPKRLFTTAYAV